MNALTMRSLQSVALLAACLSLFTSGCGHPTAIISATTAPPAIGSTDTAHPTNLPGVPFYIKRGMCKRETIWAEPKHTLQLAILQDGKPAATRSITYPHSFQQNSELETLVENLNLLAVPPKDSDPAKLCQTVNDVANQWKALAEAAKQAKRPCDVVSKQSNECESLVAAERTGDILLVSNSASIVAEVDYEHVYYMNTRTPWIGSASVDTKLNLDGTLSEGNVQVTDQTWSTILGTVNALAGDFTTFASAKFTAPAATGNEPIENCTPSSGWPVPSVDVVYRITSSTEVYLHDHELEDPGLGASCKPLDGGVTEGNVTITKKDASPAKDDASTIKVSGTVTLPKADPATKK
ncbi:MAG TPA: hypothetical protein VGE85_00785 [Terracidiphilus sp.]|jgi:hypothetical protein